MSQGTMSPFLRTHKHYHGAQAFIHRETLTPRTQNISQKHFVRNVSRNISWARLHHLVICPGEAGRNRSSLSPVRAPAILKGQWERSSQTRSIGESASFPCACTYMPDADDECSSSAMLEANNVITYLRSSATEARLGSAFEGLSRMKFGFA